MGFFSLQPVAEFNLRVEQVMRGLQVLEARVELAQEHLDDSPETAGLREEWYWLDPLRVVRADASQGWTLLLEIDEFSVNEHDLLQTGRDHEEYHRMLTAITEYEVVAADHKRIVARLLRRLSNHKLIGKLTRLAGLGSSGSGSSSESGSGNKNGRGHGRNGSTSSVSSVVTSSTSSSSSTSLSSLAVRHPDSGIDGSRDGLRGGGGIMPRSWSVRRPGRGASAAAAKKPKVSVVAVHSSTMIEQDDQPPERFGMDRMPAMVGGGMYCR